MGKMEDRLKKITSRERMFLFNFLVNRTGEGHIDSANFARDLLLYKFKHRIILRRLFNHMKRLTQTELRSIGEELESQAYRCYDNISDN